MAAGALARVELAHAQRGFLVAAAIAVDCNRDRDRTLAFHAFDVVLRDLEFVGRIELRPDRPAARGDHVGDRGACLCREDHQMVADLGGSGDTLLAVGMIAAMPAGRIDDDRRFVLLSENLRAHIDLADVDKAARTELETS